MDGAADRRDDGCCDTLSASAGALSRHCVAGGDAGGGAGASTAVATAAVVRDSDSGAGCAGSGEDIRDSGSASAGCDGSAVVGGSPEPWPSSLRLQSFVTQSASWPAASKTTILAHHDDATVVVYQAFCRETGEFAAAHGYFGGPRYSLTRMSWIKPQFMWMMHRCGWASKPGQEVVLAIRLRRSAFDAIVDQAVPASYDDDAARTYGTRDAWSAAVRTSEVRVQWDPDHGPHGEKKERRAIQLGLRGSVLAAFAREWIVSIEDVSPFVRWQKSLLDDVGVDALTTPVETVYRRCGAEAIDTGAP
jgi:hypothetical protein